MVITPHALTGALAGSRFPIPAALLAGVASHYLLDRVPHRDYSLRAGGGALLALDAVVASALVATSRGSRAGAIGGILPDLALVASHHLRAPVLDLHRRFHDANHTRRRCGLGLEVATQVATCLIAFAALRDRKTR